MGTAAGGGGPRRPGWTSLMAVAGLGLLGAGCQRATPGAGAPGPSRTDATTVAPTIAARPESAPTPAPPGARPTEVDFGLPFYPGAVFEEGSLQRADMGAFYQVHASFETDAGAEKVASFYRSKLTALAPNKDAFVETRQADKITLMLKRDPGNMSLVAIEPREGVAGSTIQLTATGARAAATPSAPAPVVGAPAPGATK